MIAKIEVSKNTIIGQSLLIKHKNLVLFGTLCLASLFLNCMKRLYIFLFAAFLVGGTCNLTAQRVLVKGRVTATDGNTDFFSLFVVSQKNRVGNFGSPNGTFEMQIDKDDTILIGSVGYETAKVSVADSALKDTYYIVVELKPLEVQLREVRIFSQRELNQIYNDIEKLGYNPKRDVVSGVSFVESPITALYVAFSRKEQKKREARMLINESKKRDLLKELFAKYADAGIIDLEPSEFDDFIDFLQVSDDFLKNSSQYQFIEYVKLKYKIYHQLHKYDGWEEY